MTKDLQGSQINVGIVGSRMRTNPQTAKFINELVLKLKASYGEKLCIVSGGCYGPDKFAEDAARTQNVKTIIHPVDQSTPIKNKWEFRKRAFARNSLIARDSTHSLFAFVWRGRKGGTEDTVTKYSEYIVSGEPRKLYIIHEDFSVDIWRPETEIRSKWEICQGNVSRLG